MACWTNLIGVKNCGKEYSYYLDNYNLSLTDLAKIADEKHYTGQNLLDSFIDIAWQKVINDIKIKGYDFNKILEDISLEVNGNNPTVIVGGTHDVSFKLGKCCKTVSYYLNSIKPNIKTDGLLKILLIDNDGTTTLFDGTTNGSQTININKWVSGDFILRVDLTQVGSATLNSSIFNQNICECSCAMYEIDQYANGLDICVQIRCDKSKHLCKYVDLLVPMAINHILGQFWFKVHTSNRANDHKIFKDVDALSQMAFYNSEYLAMVQFESKTVIKEGQYQIEMNSLNLPLPKCNCCLECRESITTEITIP